MTLSFSESSSEPLRLDWGSTHHLVTGGPHHPGQDIEQVLPLQEL